ncbi:MAG: ABC transporter substrate-binding protein [Candidatus Limnocylindria bacterium]
MPIKSLLLPAVALTVATALAGCGSSATTAADAAAGSGGSGGKVSSIGVGYFQSATLGPEVLIAGNKSLGDKIDGKLKLTPIDSGVVGLSELRGGAFPFVSGVGNPPVVGAIAQGTKLKVIYAEYFDAAQLIVGPDITSNEQLAGKTIGDLQGSSEDFEIRGWLSKQGLTDKVKVVGFPSEAAVAAAFKAHRIDAGYVEIAQALDLTKNADGRAVVTAEEIAKLGFPSLNVLAVTDDFAADHPDIVQQVVCQTMRAETLAAGPDADTYIKAAAGTVGATPDDAAAATKVIPWVSGKDELSWFDGPSGDVKDGQIAKAYALTAQFLKDQGRVTTLPAADQIASALDDTYVKQALKDGCDQ